MEAFLVIYVGLVIWVIVICVQKGKPGMAWLGLLTGWTVIIGAIRIAKPDSTWAQKNYPPGSVKWQLARNRFPQAMPPHESPPPVAPLLQQAPPTQPAVWLPTHQIPEGGLKARERPDPVLPEILRIRAGEEVRVVSTNGVWAKIITAKDWTAWVDGQRLIEIEKVPGL